LKEAELRGRFEMESRAEQPKILCRDLADLFLASLQKKLKPSSIYTRSSFYQELRRAELRRLLRAGSDERRSGPLQREAEQGAPGKYVQRRFDGPDLT
jgi:hypothetical protein